MHLNIIQHRFNLATFFNKLSLVFKIHILPSYLLIKINE